MTWQLRSGVQWQEVLLFWNDSLFITSIFFFYILLACVKEKRGSLLFHQISVSSYFHNKLWIILNNCREVARCNKRIFFSWLFLKKHSPNWAHQPKNWVSKLASEFQLYFAFIATTSWTQSVDWEEICSYN